MAPNLSRIGTEYTVAGRVFAARTPRAVLGDALDDEGRAEEAALLRGAAPVVFDQIVRLPGASEVAKLCNRLVPTADARPCHLVPDVAHEFDVISISGGAARVGLDGRPRFRWRATESGRVFAALRRRRPGLDDPVQVPRYLLATSVPIEALVVAPDVPLPGRESRASAPRWVRLPGGPSAAQTGDEPPDRTVSALTPRQREDLAVLCALDWPGEAEYVAIMAAIVRYVAAEALTPSDFSVHDSLMLSPAYTAACLVRYAGGGFSPGCPAYAFLATAGLPPPLRGGRTRRD